MKKNSYEEFMWMAIKEAANSLREGNKGFGAVAVRNGRIIARSHDSEVSDSDPTAHAEMNLIRKLSKEYRGNLSGCTIISTHEPCPMCMGAIVWAKVSEVVYGASIKDTVNLGKNRIKLSCKEIVKRSRWKLTIRGGVLREECLKLYDNEVRKLIRSFGMTEKIGWKSMEDDLIKKRIKWFEENKDNIIKKLRGTDVEKAYQLILMKIGIKRSEAPIVKRAGEEIVFHSRNFCPALEACRILQLDTRKICKLVFEKPTEELIKRLNPKLKFTRNYERIRPYATFCEEIIKIE
jgi:tRNA(Arg) A34 adenosine deaminase TadA